MESQIWSTAPQAQLGKPTHFNHDIYRYCCSIDPKQRLELITRAYQDKESLVILPYNFKPDAVFFDMDATVIAQESLDLIAGLAGVVDEVKRLTEAAMAGEIGFAEALTRRVKLIEGKSADLLHQARSMVSLSRGVDSLAKKCHANNVEIFLVTGGFRDFAKPLADLLGFKDFVANKFEIADGILTGRILGEIVDAEKKAEFAKKMCSLRKRNSSVAIGDGANDLEIMKVCDIAIGYRPKKVLLDYLHGIVGPHESHFFLQFVFFDQT